MNLRLILLFNELPQVDVYLPPRRTPFVQFFIYSCTNEFLVITFNYGYASFISFKPHLDVVQKNACIKK
ncbi:hypothetical protein C452_13089 [Haloferax volcanii JCM 10717]|uniref:Uncharacterized protein n=3 Tax=Haloferax volcanii TaxID=2246 RepID=A0A558GF65_HALVO|nr:hypothetical protein D320_03716 [Haloferax sp. BAB-2207]ELZ75138.1 hypothetical protein C456_07752 [Haloferax lucentense DSM 14919]ELZ88399.1 hypothetical protein C452_13089 [Haloferax alexandrinus JCM 10717]NLV03435.1 hypothetical protein [Haloferax alexandrinus]TVT96383.1 hypothetical protein FQA18_01405 [Haloferax volcanii]